MNGYYSAKMESHLGGHCVYSTTEGKEVVVTMVGDNPPNWDDAFCVGEVSEFIRSTIPIDKSTRAAKAVKYDMPPSISNRNPAGNSPVQG